MKKIAVIQFPGTNCEYETAAAAAEAGMDAEIFRWNKDPELLAGFDGFILPGGFSYQDRVRAGAVGAKTRIMKTLFAESQRGKPVLGICNGAQILVESGILPGIEPGRVEMALAPNTGRTGYYCRWIYMKTLSSPGQCAFTGNLKQGEIIPSPVAHAEGRFAAGDKNLVKKLAENGQIVFKYSNFAGEAADGFPANPNGSIEDIAGISNPAGNVLGLMPHPERAAFIRQIPDNLSGEYGRMKQAAYGSAAAFSRPGPGLKIFRSMADFLEGKTDG